MSTYEFDKILTEYANERMSVEMTMGHALQHIDKLYAQITILTQALQSLRADVDSLITHAGLSPSSPGKQPTPKTR
ncbi:MAG: hypothetical protein U0350_25110 [Caldilineaceae bacterium]